MSVPSRRPRSLYPAVLVALVLISLTTPPSLRAQSTTRTRPKPAAAPAAAPANATPAEASTPEAKAAALKIEMLLAHDQRPEALEVYDAFRKSAKRDVPSLLAPIARSELQALTHADLTSMQSEALGALAADGDGAARHQLEQAAGATTVSAATVSANEALAKLDDARAAERLVAFASQIEPGRRAMMLRTIATVPHAPALTLVRESLTSADPMAQAAAAGAAATLGLKPLEPELRQVLAKGDPFARNAASLALMQLGDAAAKDRTRTLLTSPAPPVRLQAARALEQIGDRSWVADVKPLLADPDGLTRFQAAELMLPIDRPAALEVLQAGIADPNPAIRGECARILTADAGADAALLRTLLGDAAPHVRLLAASTLLAQLRATAQAAPAARRQ